MWAEKYLWYSLKVSTIFNLSHKFWRTRIWGMALGAPMTSYRPFELSKEEWKMKQNNGYLTGTLCLLIDWNANNGWLVVSTPLKNMLVSWDYIVFPIYGKIKKCSKPPTKWVRIMPNILDSRTPFFGTNQPGLVSLGSCGMEEPKGLGHSHTQGPHVERIGSACSDISTWVCLSRNRTYFSNLNIYFVCS